MTKLIDQALERATDTKAIVTGRGVVDRTGDVFTSTFGDAACILVADENTWAAAGEQVKASLEAAAVKTRFTDLVAGAARMQRMAPLAATAEVIAARRGMRGGWELVCVRYGRLAGTSVTPPGADPVPFIETLRATAEVVPQPSGPIPAARHEEVHLDRLRTRR